MTVPAGLTDLEQLVATVLRDSTTVRARAADLYDAGGSPVATLDEDGIAILTSSIYEAVRSLHFTSGGVVKGAVYCIVAVDTEATYVTGSATTYIAVIPVDPALGENIYLRSPLVRTSADLKVGGSVGFYGTTPAAKPEVTGSRGGNTALASALTALATLGLITDSSSS